jgi:outer membrane receptor protein involved in Fe transport
MVTGMSYLFKVLCLFFYLLLFSFQAATGCTWKFRVNDNRNNPIRHAHISIKELNTESVTTKDGLLTFNKGVTGKYTLCIRAIHFQEQEIKLVLPCDGDSTYNIMMEPELQELKEVTIKSQSATTWAKERAFNMETVQVKELHSRSSDMVALLNRLPGVRLRSDGYLGAAININLGGLQGKAVRMFRDGIPLDIFGHGYDPALISVNMLDRVEVYKGVIPVSLGADALGGGINFVSRKLYRPLLEASYEAGSFQTHKFTLNACYSKDSSRFFAGTSFAFNYSANNYKVIAPLLDPFTAQQLPTSVKRFHDATRSVYAEVFAGWRKLAWADEIRFTLIGSGLYKQVQHDAQMNKVYGQASGTDKGITSMLHWNKKFFDHKLVINVSLVYSYFKTNFTDTATTRYNWDGSLLAYHLPAGEINNGSLQQLNFHFYTARAYAAYALHKNHSLELSSTFTARKRTGTDPYGAKTTTEDPLDILRIPAHYRKSASGLGIHSLLFNERLENNIALKYYYMQANGYSSDNYGFTKKGNTDQCAAGFMEAIRYRFTDNWLGKMSYEYATRQPEEAELFGDGIMIRDNVSLQPEKSHNANAQIQYQNRSTGNGTIAATAAFFYRKVQHLILLQSDIPYNRYINYDNAHIKGVELDIQYSPFPFLSLGANGTYQDIRRVGIMDPNLRFLENSRVNNIPFLFGNLSAACHFDHVLLHNSRLELFYDLNYVHRFFLLPVSKQLEPSLFGAVQTGISNLMVPNDGRTGQTMHNAGLVYHLPLDRISFALECTNISNTLLFDNFKVQRPGRAFHLKLKWQLTSAGI